jgi:spore maturation protein CgeB
VRDNTAHDSTLLIIGNKAGTNVGGSLLRGAQALGFDGHLIETYTAMDAPISVRRFNWWFRGHRPTWLGEFSKQVVKNVLEIRPSCLLATGIAPIQRKALEEIGQLGVVRINYLTDDPWNPSHRASWFLKALPEYDYIFSTRRANLADLTDLGCAKVSYLPFGYDESLFYPERSSTQEERAQLRSEIVFAGGADRDRIPYIAELAKAGFKVALYGDYWDRYPETRRLLRGYADPQILRKAIGATKVALCLVRRANRDGNSMRTFEVPAIGACMLLEDTAEHREIFGAEKEAVAYFRSIDEMINKLRWLLDHDVERIRLARAAHQLIVNGRHTYKDRLATMLGREEVLGFPPSERSSIPAV